MNTGLYVYRAVRNFGVVYARVKEGPNPLSGAKVYVQTAGDSALTGADGTVASGGDAGSIHRLGAKVQGLDACNGWTFWHFDDAQTLRPIDDLRSIIRNDLAKAE